MRSGRGGRDSQSRFGFHDHRQQQAEHSGHHSYASAGSERYQQSTMFNDRTERSHYASSPNNVSQQYVGAAHGGQNYSNYAPTPPMPQQQQVYPTYGSHTQQPAASYGNYYDSYVGGYPSQPMAYDPAAMAYGVVPPSAPPTQHWIVHPSPSLQVPSTANYHQLESDRRGMNMFIASHPSSGYGAYRRDFAPQVGMYPSVHPQVHSQPYHIAPPGSSNSVPYGAMYSTILPDARAQQHGSYVHHPVNNQQYDGSSDQNSIRPNEGEDNA